MQSADTAGRAAASSRTILVVDDEPGNRDIFRMLFEHAGYRVVVAADGAEGVSAAREHRPDVVLMDLAMPVMDGWRATRALKAAGSTAAIPVLAFTARVVEPRELQRAGFCAYVPKPVSPKRLLAAVVLCLDAGARGKAWVDLSAELPAAAWP